MSARGSRGRRSRAGRATGVRDLALHAGRMRCGLTLRELGEQAGGMGVQAAAKACGRIGDKLNTDKGLQRALARVRRILKRGRK